MIQTIDEIISERIHECTEKVGETFASSIRPLYASNDKKRPELVGTCLLVTIDNSKYAITAAHLTDWVSTHALYVAGKAGTEPIQIVGNVKSTPLQCNDRERDKLDIAFWKVPSEVERLLGDVVFLTDNCFSFNKTSPNGRYYLAAGYPLSRNKNKVSFSDKTIVTVYSKYTGSGVADLDLQNTSGYSHKHHIFVKHGKYSSNDKGEKVSTVKPVGLSGGALIDLGRFESIPQYESDCGCNGMLSGMIIEKSKKFNALVAVKIQCIVQAIRDGRIAL